MKFIYTTATDTHRMVRAVFFSFASSVRHLEFLYFYHLCAQCTFDIILFVPLDRTTNLCVVCAVWNWMLISEVIIKMYAARVPPRTFNVFYVQRIEEKTRGLKSDVRLYLAEKNSTRIPSSRSRIPFSNFYSTFILFARWRWYEVLFFCFKYT